MVLVVVQFSIPDLNELTVDLLPEVFFRRALAPNAWSLDGKATSGTLVSSRSSDYGLSVTVEADTTELALAKVLGFVNQIPTVSIGNCQTAEVPADPPALPLETEPVKWVDVTIRFVANMTQQAIAGLFDSEPLPRSRFRVLENRGGSVVAEVVKRYSAKPEDSDADLTAHALNYLRGILGSVNATGEVAGVEVAAVE